MLRVLILGGTTEANGLIERLAGDLRFTPILSLAGRTQAPRLPDVEHRVGGFGGVTGLVDYLRTHAIGALIDATHPFAEQISANAIAAALRTGVPLAVLTRPAWTAQAGERWREFPNARRAALAIGAAPRRVFLTIGRLRLAAFEAAPQHDYLIRSIEPPDPFPALPHYRFIFARGPFGVADEAKLMREASIEVIVSKNSGGSAMRTKIDAARMLDLEIFMIGRPKRSDVITLETPDDAIRFLESHLHRAAP